MSKIDKELLKGSTTVIVLNALNRGEKYGYEIIKAITTESKGSFEFKEGTLYPILHQLENDGAISSRWEETESARKRKYYRITPKGKKLLDAKKQAWLDFRAAVDQILTGFIAQREE
jgi:PadR family transcriptional regulator PadR